MEPDDERWKELDSWLDGLKLAFERKTADDLTAAGSAAIPTSTIYHYTDAATALEIIKSGHFWFGERAHLNDTLELQYGFRIGHDMFDTAAKAISACIPRTAADHLMGEINDGLVEYGYWVVSFSFDDDDLSQWRSYADEGSGLWLGFAVQRLDMKAFADHIPEHSIIRG